MRKLGALIELARPGNAAMSAVGVAVGALATMRASEVPWLPVGLAAAAALLGTAAGNAYNDVRDRDLDAMAHPARPIPSGRLTSGAAFDASVVLFGLALALAWFAHAAVFALALANVALLFLYEHRAKASGVAGNALVAWLVASLFLMGGLAATQPTAWVDLAALAAPLLLAALAFSANVARELVKDAQDLDADRGMRTTVPMQFGAVRTRRLATAVLAAGVVVSPLPYALGMGFSWVFLALAVAADAVLLAGVMRRDPGEASRWLKAGMVVALAAFGFGRL